MQRLTDNSSTLYVVVSTVLYLKQAQQMQLLSTTVATHRSLSALQQIQPCTSVTAPFSVI